MEYEGLHFPRGTSKAVAKSLVSAFRDRKEVRIYLGDRLTGKDDLALYNTIGYLTMVGGSQPSLRLTSSEDNLIYEIDFTRVVKITTEHEVVYQHLLYHLPTIEVYPMNNGRMSLLSDGKRITTSVTTNKSRYVFKYLNGLINHY